MSLIDGAEPGMTVPVAGGKADPFEGLEQTPFDPAPLTEAEARKRQHAAAFALSAADNRLPLNERENAIRHLLACDPGRGLGCLASLLSNAFDTLERELGSQSGDIIDVLRADLEIHQEADAVARIAPITTTHEE